MRRLAPAVLGALLALAVPAAAEEPLPPPPPPPPPSPYDLTPAPPAPAAAPATPAPFVPGLRPGPKRAPGTIGEGLLAPAGSPAAPLHPDESISHWRFSLATGVAGRFGGYQLESAKQNSGLMLYFAGQADGLWTEGYGQAARFRVRMFTGGESEIYFVSDGDAEAAYMIGRREFRFVIGRAEVARYPALAVQTLAQLSTLPCFEGSLSLANDTMRFYYYVSPVAAAWVRYYGGAHIEHSAGWATESDVPGASSSGRVRYTVLLPPAMLLSLQGDLVKLWNKPDMLLAAEGSLGYQVLDQSAVFNATVRWQSFRRRGDETAPGTSATESEVLLLGVASLVF
ncbi:MAG TPA: hypothetical protein VFL83_12645 [Anaeromyxobacter sp.]|nr:hypothetical protein [Anaeromyxobacter sp.]